MLDGYKRVPHSVRCEPLDYAAQESRTCVDFLQPGLRMAWRGRRLSLQSACIWKEFNTEPAEESARDLAKAALVAMHFEVISIGSLVDASECGHVVINWGGSHAQLSRTDASTSSKHLEIGKIAGQRKIHQFFQ